jgi:hypothetical protein
VENEMVELTWVRPDDGYRILGKDSPVKRPLLLPRKIW